jgi:hypothetical protein
MRIRAYLVGTLACLAITAGWVAGCGGKSTPVAPTVATPTVAALIVKGNPVLTSPGQTTQLTLQATLSDGSTKDVTSTAQWFTSNGAVVTVSPAGLATAMGFGRASVSGGYGPGAAPASVITAPAFLITVLPEGTYILSGRVTEGDNLPIANARVEIVGGAMSDRVAMTGGAGNYAFNGVSGVAQVRATKDGYEPAIQSVTPDTEHVNIALTPTLPYASLGGGYSLTFTASPSCSLPDDVMKRTYAASIDQRGASLTVVLSGAQFANYGQMPLDRFSGRVLGTAVSFNLATDFYYGLADLVEQLANDRFLSFFGTAEATATEAGMSTLFAGVVSLTTQVLGGKPIAVCTASDHRLVFTRPVATSSRKRF